MGTIEFVESKNKETMDLVDVILKNVDKMNKIISDMEKRHR